MSAVLLGSALSESPCRALSKDCRLLAADFRVDWSLCRLPQLEMSATAATIAARSNWLWDSKPESIVAEVPVVVGGGVATVVAGLEVMVPPELGAPWAAAELGGE